MTARPLATVERQARPVLTTTPRAVPDPLEGDPSPAAEPSTLVEHELRRVPLAVVTRWAVALAVSIVVVWWAAMGVVWLAAATFGLTGDIESLAHDVGFEGFRLASAPVILAVGLLGVAAIVAIALLVVFAAAAYNAYAAFLGGIRVEAVERVVGDGTATTAPAEPARTTVD